MKKLFVLAGALLVLSGASSEAQAQIYYAGVHPVHPSVGGGFCHLSDTHSHPYTIDANISYLYRMNNGAYYFMGNPYQFGYMGQAFPYYGHHPLPAVMGSSFCYLDGAHHHHFVPPAYYSGSFLVSNGYYYYNGAYPAYYYSYRPSYYRRAHTFWYTPAYRTYYNRYRNNYWRSYTRAARVRYFRNAPRVTYRYRTAPVYRARTYRNYSRPVYRSSYYRPSYRSSYVGTARVSVYQTRPRTTYRRSYVTPRARYGGGRSYRRR